jgi:hypothetical protein
VIISEFHVGNSRAQNQPPGQFDIITALPVIGSYSVRQAVEPEIVEVGLDTEMAGTVQAGNSVQDIVNVAAGVKRYEAEKGFLQHTPLNRHICIAKQCPDLGRGHQEPAIEGFKEVREFGPGLKDALVAFVEELFEGHGRLPDSVGRKSNILNLAFASGCVIWQREEESLGGKAGTKKPAPLTDAGCS